MNGLCYSHQVVERYECAQSSPGLLALVAPEKTLPGCSHLYSRLRLAQYSISVTINSERVSKKSVSARTFPKTIQVYDSKSISKMAPDTYPLEVEQIGRSSASEPRLEKSPLMLADIVYWKRSREGRVARRRGIHESPRLSVSQGQEL